MPHVAIVEDNPDNMLLVQALLMGQFTLSSYESGLAAVAKMPTNVPDMVLLDISLPQMDGTEVLRWIRAQEGWGTLPVVALTAHAMQGDRERFLLEGFDAYMSKPIVDGDALVTLCQQLLAKGGTQ